MLDREGWEGAKFVCSPPPRDLASQAACWEGIENGISDLFSSDHCPFRYDDPEGKLNAKGSTSFRWIPDGIPGDETRLPILFSQGVATGRISACRFVELTAINHARIYGLYPKKGTIAVESDADLSLWDPALKRTITNTDPNHRPDYAPYEGMEITGWRVKTLLRGTVVCDGGHRNEKPASRYLLRQRSPLCA
uniref:amidohydrolase family protein n=1 Tax=Pararhizobium sp. IMCC3301 TaxID=3067904 RepID=UPI003531BE5B